LATQVSVTWALVTNNPGPTLNAVPALFAKPLPLWLAPNVTEAAEATRTTPGADATGVRSPSRDAATMTPAANVDTLMVHFRMPPRSIDQPTTSLGS
jgi:hypothetical protein